MNSNSSQSHFDKMTKTDIRPLIVKLSIPTILSLIITNVYNLVDTAFVGKLGTSASGAVGVVFGYMAIVQAIGYLFGQGAGSIVSRSLGPRNRIRPMDGAGLSTAISQLVSFGILNWMFLSGRSETRLGFRYFNRYVSYWWDMITTGLPSLLRQSLNALATVVLVRDSSLSVPSTTERASIAESKRHTNSPLHWRKAFS